MPFDLFPQNQNLSAGNFSVGVTSLTTCEKGYALY
jgi:hypothetical protein